LNARAIKFEDNIVIAPIWELVNHKVRSLPFIISKEGLSTPNYPALNSEIRFSYNNISSINRFFSYGFYSEETIVFSLPFEFTFLPSNVVLCCKGLNLNDDSMKINKSSNKIVLEGLPIADINNRKLPSDYFDEIQRRLVDVNLPKDTLSQIFQYNISIRNKIIFESQLINNQASKTLTKVMNYETSLISSQN